MIKVLTQNPPQKFVYYPLTPQKNLRDQRMLTRSTAQKRLWAHPLEKFIQRVGVDVKWNGPS
jgi:hypothetical protein